MVGQRRAPGMQHGGQSDAGAKMLGVGGDGDQRFGRRLEQQVVDDGLVLPGNGGDRRRQGEHDVEVGNRQQLGFALGQPFLGGNSLALRTVAIAAGVVGDAHVRTILASLDMAAESRGTAALDGRHDLQLREAHLSGVGVAPGRAVAAKDIRQLDCWTRQAVPRSGGRSTSVSSRSSGLVTSPIALMATRV